MGWLWASRTAPESAPPTQPSTSASKSASTTTTATLSIPPPAPENAQSQPAATPPHPDDEFNSAFPHLAPQVPSESSSSSQSPTLYPEYPTTMSCRAAFDSAFYCASLGGHFNHIYRYGELRSCSEHWADWRFCMGLKARSKEDKQALIQERYRQKEEKTRSQPNSERLWERRKEGERYFGAFRPEEEAEASVAKK